MYRLLLSVLLLALNPDLDSQEPRAFRLSETIRHAPPIDCQVVALFGPQAEYPL
jgi:hypothetical protein